MILFNFWKKSKVYTPPTIPDFSSRVEPDHVHQWEKKLTTYAPPVIPAHASSPPSDRQAFGLTIILWECLVCHEHKVEELLGTDKPAIDELLTKVESYGPQYVQRNNSTFVITKYIPQGVTVR
jgi:hypothetical protein